jgi:hypothetical protein
MSEHQEGLAVTVAITTAAAAVVLAVLVALLGQSSVGGSSPSPGPSAACQEWTDSCVICARTPVGLACSTPGIACIRGPIQCLRP